LAVVGRTVLTDFAAHVSRGEVVRLVGPNGAVHAAPGNHRPRRAPASGTLRVPDSVQIAYYRQDLAQVPRRETLRDHRASAAAVGRGAIQSHLGRFGFSGDSVRRRAARLSGAERTRVALAMTMLSGADFVVFDEATNHLDVETIEALKDAIETYDGTCFRESWPNLAARAHDARMDPAPRADYGLPWHLGGMGSRQPGEGACRRNRGRRGRGRSDG
jgi:ATP-binding cassette subfamily F protein 3